MNSYFKRIDLSNAERHNVSETSRKVQVHGMKSEYTFFDSEQLSGSPSFSDKLPAASDFRFAALFFFQRSRGNGLLLAKHLARSPMKARQITRNHCRSQANEQGRTARGRKRNERPAKDLFDER